MGDSGWLPQAPSGTPEVSVVIPTRDRCLYLTQAIDSVFRQEAVDLELIVVDDSSTDATADHLATVADPRLRTVRHPRSLGVSRARNHGIELARGRWVAFLDDDDLWAPAKLALQLSALRHEGALWSYTSVAHFDDRAGSARLIRSAAPSEGILAANPASTPSSGVVSRAVLERIGGFDPQLMIMADWDLWIRLMQVGSPAVLGEVLVGRRIHVANMSTSGRRVHATISRERRYMLDKHRELFRNEELPLRGREFLLWCAGLYRLEGARVRA